MTRCPAPMFDDLHPLSSPIPLAPCTDERFFAVIVDALGHPDGDDARVEQRVRDEAHALALEAVVVESSAAVVLDEAPVDDLPPTAPLTLVPTAALPLGPGVALGAPIAPAAAVARSPRGGRPGAKRTATRKPRRAS